MSGADSRVAVVTGAASGIGRALALALDGRGFTLVLSDVDAKGLEETQGALKRPASLHACDVADRKGVHALAEEVLAKHGHVDWVVNNAGVDVAHPIASVSYEDFEWLFNINFWGVVHGTKAFLPSMLERKSGVVVNVSSVFGLIGFPMHGTYCASKFAVRGFTESLRQELKGTGVRAVCVHPGGIKTNIVRNSRFRSDRFVKDKDGAVKFFEKRLARTTAQAAAETIVTGVEKGKSRILIGADALAIDRVQRLFPELYQQVFEKLQP